MTTLKLIFAGTVKNVRHRNAGDKQVMEIAICKPVKGRNGAKDTFTWVNVTIWEPPEWIASQIQPGVYVSGIGDFTLRSYEDKEGKPKTSADVRCSSFDIDIAKGEQAVAPEAKPQTPQRPVAPAIDAEPNEPPF